MQKRRVKRLNDEAPVFPSFPLWNASESILRDLMPASCDGPIDPLTLNDTNAICDGSQAQEGVDR